MIMICKFTVENFKAFAEKVDLVFYVDGNIKRLNYNYVEGDSGKILKTAGFYGPNNTGKTCLFLALWSLRALMLNEKPGRLVNAFANRGDVTSFSVEYCISKRLYAYSVDYNSTTKEYEKEKLVLKSDEEAGIVGEVIFDRNKRRLTWKGIPRNLNEVNAQRLFSNSFPFMLALNDENNKEMSQARKDYLDFAHSILFLKMDGPVDITKTLNLIQTDPRANQFVKEFVKNCDLSIDDFGFDDKIISNWGITE